ncbi:hypothetical protein N657DRAFT_325843 [Parathielavia appendiculata]|uniref:Uncharacterized protein n=1 Tax=Parathielavia appendiculata TaxID=2587402 RepID=A0AAN6TQL9_9PEZI|nr:hypothetical protein N657DRAFT_325843 [Parathielavia appendiculata]
MHRRLSKITADIERWKQEGNRLATVEKTEREATALRDVISQLSKEHLEGQFGGSPPRRRTDRNNHRRTSNRRTSYMSPLD